MADPLRAMLRVVRERLTEEGMRELAHAMLDAALDELAPTTRQPARRAAPAIPDAPVDEITAARARRAAERLLG